MRAPLPVAMFALVALGCGDPAGGTPGVLESDCGPGRAILSAGWLGCDPAVITVDDCRVSELGGSEVAWRASCEGRVVWCSQSGGDDLTVRCAPAAGADAGP